MADYSQVTSFGPKDALVTGNPSKKIRGSEFDTEFGAISTAIGTKFDSSDVASNAEAAALSSDVKLLTPAKLSHALQNSSVVLGANVKLGNVLGSVAGTNTITGSLTPALAAYTAGMLAVFTPANTNTGAATLNINSLGALDIQKADGDALVAGDLVAGIPAVLVLDSGADDWILLNPMHAAFASLDVSGAMTLNGVLATDNTTADEVGFKGLPQNIQNSNYTAVLADASKSIIATTSAGHTFTIPSNASVPYPVGTVLTFVNFTALGPVTIAITSDTMYLGGTNTTGSRSLGILGVATAYKATSTAWIISGTGLS